jgi:uncharacterized protein (UPF0218 family)
LAAITHVFTVARVAEMLEVDEDMLHEIAIEMEPEDGRICVYGVNDEGVMAFTRFGIENLRELLQIHQQNAATDHPELNTKPPKVP